jgi:histidyl-tRNA synthetase
MQKQMKYANDIQVKYVAIVGENEIENEIIQLKNMETGEQEEVSVEELIMKIRD